jgi:pentatricopeptide repeat protein
MLDEGLRIFESVSNMYVIEPQIHHYACLVDLLGRAGRIEEAKKVKREMTLHPYSYILGGACMVMSSWVKKWLIAWCSGVFTMVAYVFFFQTCMPLLTNGRVSQR